MYMYMHVLAVLWVYLKVPEQASEGIPLGLGSVVEDEPSTFHVFMCIKLMVFDHVLPPYM